MLHNLYECALYMVEKENEHDLEEMSLELRESFLWKSGGEMFWAVVTIMLELWQSARTHGYVACLVYCSLLMQCSV